MTYISNYLKTTSPLINQFCQVLDIDSSVPPDHLAKDLEGRNNQAIEYGFVRLTGLCIFDPLVIVLSYRFRNRTILPFSFLRETLLSLDGPLCEFLDVFGLVDDNVLLKSAFACTLADEELGRFWAETLLMQDPDVLVHVTVLAMMEVREMLFECTEKVDVEDILWTIRSILGKTRMDHIIEIAKEYTCR